jgi:C-22 sterol desaturase
VAPLSTRSIYLDIQDRISRKYYARWIAEGDGTHKSIMLSVRDFNMEVSLKVFCGPHIPDTAVREISDKYWQITKALELVNFPLALPGTKIYGAIQARKVAMKWLTSAAEKSKRAIEAGAQVECLIDAWVKEVQDMNANLPEGKGNNSTKTKRDFSAREMAQAVLSFLFASQDAMSSGIIYMFQHLADHPNVLAKIREEQLRVRGGDVHLPMSLDMLDQMPYLRACVKESLRVKPPVTMVSVPRRSARAKIESSGTNQPNSLSLRIPGSLQDDQSISHRAQLHSPE